MKTKKLILKVLISSFLVQFSCFSKVNASPVVVLRISNGILNTRNDCIQNAERAMRKKQLQLPSVNFHSDPYNQVDTHPPQSNLDDRDFVIGSSDTYGVIIDCSQANNNRLTVVTSSLDPDEAINIADELIKCVPSGNC